MVEGAICAGDIIAGRRSMENKWLRDEFKKFMDPMVFRTPEGYVAVKRAVDYVNERFEAALRSEKGTHQIIASDEIRKRWYGGTSK